jgi:hypothetical protein
MSVGVNKRCINNNDRTVKASPSMELSVFVIGNLTCGRKVLTRKILKIGRILIDRRMEKRGQSEREKI